MPAPLRTAKSANASRGVAHDASRGLRERILLESTRLFAERGYAGASMREVSEAAECTKPALYYYFTNKEALFLAVVKAEADIATEVLQRALQRSGPIRPRILQGFEEYFAHIRANPVGLAVLLRSQNQPEQGQPALDMGSVRESHSALLRNLLEQGVDEGEVRADLSLDDAVLLLGSFAEHACCRMVFEAEVIDDDRLARIVDLFFRGAAP